MGSYFRCCLKNPAISCAACCASGTCNAAWNTCHMPCNQTSRPPQTQKYVISAPERSCPCRCNAAGCRYCTVHTAPFLHHYWSMHGTFATFCKVSTHEALIRPPSPPKVTTQYPSSHLPPSCGTAALRSSTGCHADQPEPTPASSSSHQALMPKCKQVCA